MTFAFNLDDVADVENALLAASLPNKSLTNRSYGRREHQPGDSAKLRMVAELSAALHDFALPPGGEE